MISDSFEGERLRDSNFKACPTDEDPDPTNAPNQDVSWEKVLFRTALKQIEWINR
jgi:hypothetical protein